ncbi:STAS-like domain-containing protein [Patescibacteria group bacterium]
MDIRKVIVNLVNSKEIFTTNDVLKALKGKFSRAYVLRFINDLIREGKLAKSGTTRSALYVHVDKKDLLGNIFQKRYKNKNLKEHEVLEEVIRKLFFLNQAPEHIQSIFAYAFSEMLNNAIDHSKSENISIKVEKIGKIIRFVVDDFGIGVFRSIMQKRKLKSSLEAIQDLLKGKTTTKPHAHSGEGIFFTSKVADVFTLDSYGSQLRLDNLVDDVFVNDLKPSKSGTRVIFEINVDHSGHLDDVFKQYYTDPEDFAFDKTEIKIKLYTKGSIYVSRSQAKRVLSGLEKFRTIILDFDQVPGVGQAFADEIFRVFQTKYPEIKIIPENMIEAVRFMIERVEKV